jgi:hypothetical protein
MPNSLSTDDEHGSRLDELIDVICLLVPRRIHALFHAFLFLGAIFGSLLLNVRRLERLRLQK